MKKLISALLLFTITTTLVFGQGEITIGSFEHDDVYYNVVMTSLQDIGVNPKKDNYVKLIKLAKEEKELMLCPADSTLLQLITDMVLFDPDNLKFNAFIATTPYSEYGNDGYYIPMAVSTTDGNKLEWNYEKVGYFDMEYGPFPPLNDITILGYSSVASGFTPYDWVFLREIGKETSQP